MNIYFVHLTKQEMKRSSRVCNAIDLLKKYFIFSSEFLHLNVRPCQFPFCVVLTRFFPRDLVSSVKNPLPVGKYLDLILYSRDQINKENAAMDNDSNSDAPWGIVSIKSQDVDYELPMQPITSMRNALGEEHGGSGVPIDRNAYMT